MTAATKPTIITNPRADSAFAEAAAEHAADGAHTPQELERRLRSAWPRSRVVEGIADGETVRWYAYREGRWMK